MTPGIRALVRLLSRLMRSRHPVEADLGQQLAEAAERILRRNGL